MIANRRRPLKPKLKAEDLASQLQTPIQRQGLILGNTETYFFVIVALSLENLIQAERSRSQVKRPPDLNKLRAFMAHGGQAVIYASGI
jgi:ureidoglycolate hydrolase